MPALLSALRDRPALWARVIRDGLSALLPLTLLGAMCIVVASLPAAATTPGVWLDRVAQLQANARLIVQATLGIMGLASAMVIAMRTALALAERQRQAEPAAASIAAVAAAAFLVSVLSPAGADFAQLGYASIFEGLTIGVITAELLMALRRHWPQRREPSLLGMSPLLHHGLRLSGQAVVVLAVVLLLKSALRGLWLAWGPDLLMPWLSHGLAHLSSPTLLNLLLIVANQLMWVAGINGGQVLLQLGANGGAPVAAPDVIYASHMASPMFVNAFAHLGGAGATWGLILACLWRGTDPALRRLAWLSIVPALLNVNELLLLGIPLVFSRLLLLPFVLAPLANGLLASAALGLGLLSLDGEAVVWSTPVLLSGHLVSGGPAGPLVQAAGLLLSTLIYAPFVVRLEQVRRAREQQALKLALCSLMQPALIAPRVLDRTDGLGEIARHLLADFRADLHGPRVWLAYQPQHDRNGRVVGLEALLRWSHEVHGPIPPAAIINLAEECELIDEIGHWVIHTACRDLALWRQAGQTQLRVAVNVSPLQLETPGLAGRVAQALATHHIPPEQLEIEITEGRMMSATNEANQCLAELQALGVPMSMDDFGMGCSSLLYMQRFRMHAIKLDGSLTRDALSNPVSQDIIRSVARLGHSQGVHVVAEFVETETQRHLLGELGCDCFQGWLYSAAMPAEAVLPHLAQTGHGLPPAPSMTHGLPANPQNEQQQELHLTS